MLLRGSGEQINALRFDEEFERRITRADLIVESQGVVDAALGERLGAALGIFGSEESKTWTDAKSAWTDVDRRRPGGELLDQRRGLLGLLDVGGVAGALDHARSGRPGRAA